MPGDGKAHLTLIFHIMVETCGLLYFSPNEADNARFCCISANYPRGSGFLPTFKRMPILGFC
jgi:hypothetical protein